MDNKIRPKASKTINLYAVNCRFQYMSHIGKKNYVREKHGSFI
jgi:hypothetical protein